MGRPYYLVPEEQLKRLAATRQGRVSELGFMYQAAYAAARLASMCLSRPCLGLNDWPVRVRYDWGEDLDEVLYDGTVLHTQCKRVPDIGQPAKLAVVLVSFAAKWLWTPEAQRDKTRFRLVCCDRRFPFLKPLADYLDAATRKSVQHHFLAALGQAPPTSADRALWQSDADSLGHKVLFDGVWEATEAVYLSEVADLSHPAGPLLFAEGEALALFLTHRSIDSDRQKEGLAKLRSLIHQNLVEFDPLSSRELDPIMREPRDFDRVELELALVELRDTLSGIPRPFKVVDESYLEEQWELPPIHYVARAPEWRDVVRGADNAVKFIEREATDDLRQKVLDQLVEPIQQGIDSHLRMFFVLGAPGAGKSTLVRRVAAQLVKQQRVVVADAASGGPCAEAEDYVTWLAELKAVGRPVLLLLDDPLSEDSEWYSVLQKLNRPGFGVAVMAASPKVLYERFYNSLPRTAHVETYRLDLPTESDRMALARLYGLNEEAFRDREDDDFLVLAMEAAARVSFDGIIRRLWDTLNGGRSIPASARLLRDLPVPVRAFLVTCFFHRAYVPCRWPLVEAFVQLTANGEQVALTVAELARLRNEQGWAIFRFIEADQHHWAYQGMGVQSMHQRVAERAWEKRPLHWSDSIWEEVVRASVNAPQSARHLAPLAARLIESKDRRDQEFMGKLVDAWAVTLSDKISTRSLCEFTGSLMTLGFLGQAKKLTEPLTARAVPTHDGWLAASQLWFLAYHSSGKGSFPGWVDIPAIISAANFAHAPGRATQLFSRLRHDTVWEGLIKRLCQALEGQLDWGIGGPLLTWLLKHGGRDQILLRFDHVQMWLKEYPNDTCVRGQFLAFLGGLPAVYDKDRKQAVVNYVAWLKEHANDTFVRTQFLAFLGRLPAAYDKDRKQAVVDYAAWLEGHPNDTSVRTQFLAFLGGLPERLSDLKANGADFVGEWITTHVSTWQWSTPHSQQKMEALEAALYLVANSASAVEVQRVLLEGSTMITNAKGAKEVGVLVKALPSLYHRIFGAMDHRPLSRQEMARALANAKAAIEKWIDQNPDSGLGFPWLP